MKTQYISDTAENLLREIRNSGQTSPVAALKSDFDEKPGWDELRERNFVNCWSDDTGTEYVEVGPQQ